MPDLYAAARRRPDRPLIFDGGRSWSAHEILDRALSLQAQLEGRLGRGDEVGLGAMSPADWLAAFIAITSLGGAPVLHTAIEASPESAPQSLLAISGPDDEGRFRLRTRAGSIPLSVGVEGEPIVRDTAVDPLQPALIAFTSGTTSAPKRVIVSHQSLVSGLRTMFLGATLSSLRSPAPAAAGAPLRRPRALLLSPLSHVGGYSQLLLSLMGGPEVVFARADNASALAATLEAQQITLLAGVSPDLLWGLVQVGGEHDLSALSGLGVYGLSIGPVLAQKLRTVLPALRIGASYGLTETSGAIAFATEHELSARPGVSGLPTPNVEVMICDDAGHPRPAGEEGRIRVRGAMLMTGYQDRDDSIVDGWFDTGDRGRLDGDGYLYLAPRYDVELKLDETRRVRASQIADLIEQHPLVMEAAVVIDAEARFAHVFATVLKPGEAEHLQAWLANRLTWAAKAIAVRIVPVLPRTASGKIHREALGQIASGRADASTMQTA